jgi:hypothetical protein
VKESPVQLECRVRDIIETGNGGGAANLVICEILLVHISEDILDENGTIDQHKIRLVGRMGKDHYVKAFGDALFQVEKPLQKLGIGIDALPEPIRFSKYLTGNELGQLGNLEKLPSDEELATVRDSAEIQAIFESFCDYQPELVRLAKSYLESGHAYEALKLLMIRDI